jgi:hypothetical protein
MNGIHEVTGSTPVWSITPHPQQLSWSPRVSEFALVRRHPAIARLSESGSFRASAGRSGSWGTACRWREYPDGCSCGREFVKRRYGAPRAQTDATRHLLQLRHVVRQEDQDRVVGRVRLPPAAIRAGPSDSPDTAATSQASTTMARSIPRSRSSRLRTPSPSPTSSTVPCRRPADARPSRSPRVVGPGPFRRYCRSSFATFSPAKCWSAVSPNAQHEQAIVASWRFETATAVRASSRP